jgi:hypothetical protein
MEGLTAADERLLYLYGFVRPSIRVPRIEGVEAGTEVFLVEAGDVACAASVVPGDAYRRAPGQQPADQLEWVTPRALRHHAVITALHEAGTVLPLQFGAVCRCAEDVERLIGDLRPRLVHLLDKLRNKDEWTLRATADQAAIAARCENDAAQLVALKELERTLPDGQAYFARKQRAKLTADLVAAAIASAEDDACARLAPLAADMSRTPRHAALLVDRADLDAVTARLSDVQASEASTGLTFELVGPWPPYSFAPSLAPDSVGNEFPESGISSR